LSRPGFLLARIKAKRPEKSILLTGLRGVGDSALSRLSFSFTKPKLLGLQLG